MRRATVYLVALWLAAAGLTWAQHGEARQGSEAAHGSGGHETKSMEGWKWANFFILAAGLGYLISKNAGGFFYSRSQAIRKGLSEAQALKQRAERQTEEIETLLRGLASEIDSLKSAAREEAEHERARVAQESEQSLAKIRSNVQQEISSLTKAAQQELKEFTASLALGLARHKIEERMTPDGQDALVRAFVEGVRRQGIAPTP